MAKQLQLRRGTTAQHSTFTGAAGEVTIDTDKKVVVVHDGSTAGGTPLAKDSAKVDKVSSTDNAIVRFDGTSGAVQNSSVIIDDSGNVGIGVTPSAWHGGYTCAIEIGDAPDNGTIWSSLHENHSHIGIGANFYMDSSLTPRYKNSYPASQYSQILGRHYWQTAPSGTAGNAITWTTAMALAPSGNLLVGTTTDNGVDKLQVNGNMLIAATKKIHKVSSTNTATTTLTLTINGDNRYLSGNIDIYYSNIHADTNQTASRRYILNFSNVSIGSPRNLTEIGVGFGSELTLSNFQVIQVSGDNCNYVFTLTFPAGGYPSFIIDGMLNDVYAEAAYNYTAVIS